MICKYCKKEIPDGSIFCNICGERQTKQRKTPMSVPKPRRKKDGTVSGQLMVNRERFYVGGKTEAEYSRAVSAYKAGYLEPPKAAYSETLYGCVEKYIDDNKPVLSPSTIRGYMTCLKRIMPYGDIRVTGARWQRIVSSLSSNCSPKTVKNTWSLICAALRYAKVDIPDVNLPQLIPAVRPWLDYKQIEIFLKAVKGKRVELPALLALHSLRQSEISALTKDSLYDNYIHVRGSVVPDENNVFIKKPTNKNSASMRDVPVMIDRLFEIWPEDELVIAHPSTIRKDLIKICNEAGLPPCTIHSLRHSFASLAYHLGWSQKTTELYGGWSTDDTVGKIYTHLADADRAADIAKAKDYYSKITYEKTETE